MKKDETAKRIKALVMAKNHYKKRKTMNEMRGIPLNGDKCPVENIGMYHYLNNKNSMRELKFRAWDKEEEKLIYLNSKKHHHHSFTVKLNGNISYFNLQNGSGGEEYILMQYTGLKDKNNVEIYEGDVVRLFDGDEDLTCVEFRDGAFKVEHVGVRNIMERVNGPTGAWVNLSVDQRYCEVVGNIYKNPELLTK
jgi:uncharacterized phage protein (TIGR01671 family)